MVHLKDKLNSKAVATVSVKWTMTFKQVFFESSRLLKQFPLIFSNKISDLSNK